MMMLRLAVGLGAAARLGGGGGPPCLTVLGSRRRISATSGANS
jgi:hypothetical protein